MCNDACTGNFIPTIKWCLSSPRAYPSAVSGNSGGARQPSATRGSLAISPRPHRHPYRCPSPKQATPHIPTLLTAHQPLSGPKGGATCCCLHSTSTRRPNKAPFLLPFSQKQPLGNFQDWTLTVCIGLFGDWNTANSTTEDDDPVSR